MRLIQITFALNVEPVINFRHSEELKIFQETEELLSVLLMLVLTQQALGRINLYTY